MFSVDEWYVSYICMLAKNIQIQADAITDNIAFNSQTSSN